MWSMKSTTRIRVNSRDEGVALLGGLTIAWALDARSLAPWHILELGPERSGARSGCLCPACGERMIAVNNAKEDFKRRPHFRHMIGDGHRDCAIVAARAAVLRTMQQQGWIDLPARTVPGNFVGIDGITYSAFAHRPAQQLHVRNLDFVDHTRAVLVLEDGRHIDVVLTGTPDIDGTNGAINAMITIDVGDASLAEMSPQELRARLKITGSVCWQKHWDDDNLAKEADVLAFEMAAEHLAVVPGELQLPDDMPAELKTETVLHYAVKLILQEAGEIRLPGKTLLASVMGHQDLIERRWSLQPELVQLKDIQLESWLGGVRPDLTCSTWRVDGSLAYGTLCIEVTVTNPVDARRVARIQSLGLAALEIDLRRLSGRLTKTQLRQLVVHNISMKAWLHHPDSNVQQARLQAEVDAERAAEATVAVEGERNWHSQARGDSSDVINLEPVVAFFEHLSEHRGRYFGNDPRWITAEKLRARATEHIRQLEIRGMSGTDIVMMLHRASVLANLLAMKLERPLSEASATGFELIRKLLSGPNRLHHGWGPVYLGAALVFKLSMSEEDRKAFDDLRNTVRHDLLLEPSNYVREERYDQFLGALLPEIKDVLTKSTQGHYKSMRRRSPRRRELAPSERMSESSSLYPGLIPAWMRNSAGEDLFLKGEALAEWIRAYPERAASLGLLKNSSD